MKKSGSSLIGKISEQKDLLRTSLLFLGLIAIFNLGIDALSRVGVISPFISLTTVIASYLLHLVGIKHTTLSNEIYLASRALDVTLECTAIYIIVIYTSLVLVYPATRSKKVKGLLVGIPAIFAANMLRLVIISEVSERAPAYFDYTHDYIWRVLFILLIVAIWFYWAERKERIEA